MKSREDAIREVIYDDDNIIALIKHAPQTYNSILKEFYQCGTFQVVLRRRISRIFKNDKIWKMRIPGTRFGVVLFCTPEHDYKMIAYDGLGKTRVFYMYEFAEDDRDIIVEHYWELEGDSWNKWTYHNELLKIPKIGDRNTVVRIWD
jgi:hypothetical protein